LLREYINSFDFNQKNWNRPKKRNVSSIYLPVNRKKTKIKDISIFLDISGSVSKKDLQDFLSLLNNLFLTKLVKEINVYTFNVKIQERFNLKSDFNDFSIKSGGGTDYSCFDTVDKTDLSICITDGQCDRFPITNFPNIWLITGKYKNQDFKPKMGKVIFRDCLD
jgi:predicted metal-dependent peptidase